MPRVHKNGFKKVLVCDKIKYFYGMLFKVSTEVFLTADGSKFPLKEIEVGGRIASLACF